MPKIYVESVTKQTVSDRVTVPGLNSNARHVPGAKVQAAEVTIRAIIDDPEDITGWESAVGTVLEARTPEDWDRRDV